MLLYLTKRLFIGLLVVYLVATAVFFITRIVTNPELTFLPVDASPEQRTAVRSYLGLDEPLIAQYWDYLRNLVQFDLGESFWQPGKSALSIVLDRLPASLALNTVAIVIALLLAIPLGTIAALKPGTWLDKSVTTVSLLGLSAPQFWLGYMLMLFLGVELGWFPTSGADSTKAIVLPALALALPTAGKVAQMMRSTMIDELGRPYILTAEAKGISGLDRVTHHAFRNSLVPVLTQGSYEYVRMLAGYTVVVEKVFAWPGVGLLTVQALEQQDLMLLQAIVIVVATMVVVVNLATDVLYTRIDPRIELT